jgi:hypothetical protein
MKLELETMNVMANIPIRQARIVPRRLERLHMRRSDLETPSVEALAGSVDVFPPKNFGYMVAQGALACPGESGVVED